MHILRNFVRHYITLYEGCNKNSFDFIRRYNFILNKNCVYLLYKKYDGDVDFTISEKINKTVCRDPNSTSIPSVTGVP